MLIDMMTILHSFGTYREPHLNQIGHFNNSFRDEIYSVVKNGSPDFKC